MRMEVANFSHGDAAAVRRRERTVASEPRKERLDVRAALDRLLDEMHRSLLDGNASGAISALVAGLRRLRLIVTPDEWQQCVDRCLAHEVRALLHHDPLSRHAYENRATPLEDSVVNGYILTDPPGASLDDGVSAIGRAVHMEVVNGRWAGAVRYRRHLAARTIGECAASFASPRVLAIGAGDLQELDPSFGDQDHDVAEIVAADRVASQLAATARRARVTPLDVAVEDFESREIADADFQLVYAMNALDSFDNAAAASLLRRMFALLAPGGMLVVSSLLPDLEDGAFIEAFLGAKPRYRTAFEVLELTRDLGKRAATRLGEDESGSVVFAAVRRVAT